MCTVSICITSRRPIAHQAKSSISRSLPNRTAINGMNIISTIIILNNEQLDKIHAWDGRQRFSEFPDTSVAYFKAPSWLIDNIYEV